MRHRQFWLVTMLLLLAHPALATEKNEVSLRVLHTGVPVSGEVFEGELEIRVPGASAVENVALSGTGWLQPKLTVDTHSTVKMATQKISFTSIPYDPREPITVSFDWNGERVERELHLTPDEPERLSQVSAPVRSGSSELNSPLPPDSLAKNARNIRVRGRLVYERPDGVQIGADNAQVAIMEDDVIDGVLVTGHTDPNGNFDIVFPWAPCPVICAPNPDLYVRFKSANNRVSIDKNLIQVYEYVTDTEFNYTGVDLDFGVLTPTSENGTAALGILTNMTRAFRYIFSWTGISLSNVGAMFPDDSYGVSFYSPLFQTISITSNAAWTERTHIHEYGHHFINLHGNSDPPSYCNGVCDQSAEDCGHCIFCQETTEVAWSEGWPTWLAHSVMEASSPAPISSSFAESLQTCQGVLDNPFLTEGFFTAVLTDISDYVNEDDPLTEGFADVLNFGPNEIFTITTDNLPKTPAEFFAAFRARYPDWDADLWETAANNAYQLDNTDPPSVPTLISTSHSEGVGSTDATVDIRWTEVVDDFSGVESYFVVIQREISSGVFQLVQTVALNPTDQTTCPPLTEGRYQITVAARDRAGNMESTNFLTRLFPIDILPPDPANLAFAPSSGWYEVVMPQASAGATSTNVPLPASLEGETNSTYWNFRAANSGTLPLTASSSAALFLDGARIGGTVVGALQSREVHSSVNKGPITVRGGRHTLGIQLDEYDFAPESDELDNEIAFQWVWAPLQLFGNKVTRAAPPDRFGGHDAVPGQAWYNCDGFYHFTVTPWSAVVVVPKDLDSDYDVRQHTVASGPVNGFAENVSWSGRGRGLIDAVFINIEGPGVTNPMGAGVINVNGFSQGYDVVNVYGSNAPFGSQVTLNFASDEYLKILYTTVSTGDVGPVGVEVDAGTSGVYVGWLDVGLGPADMHSFAAESVTDGTGTARVDVQASTAGTHAFVIWRDPTVGQKAAPLTVKATAAVTPPDLVSGAPTGWHSSLVPRNADDGTSGSVPLPVVLTEGTTYLNMSLRNESSVSASQVKLQTYLDGQDLLASTWGLVAGDSYGKLNSGIAQTVPGGRHTLSYSIDPFDEIDEAYEDNNGFGEQYVWEPETLFGALPLIDRAPGKRAAWSEIPVNEVAWYNCAGYRTPVPITTGETGWWRAVSILPYNGIDIDVRLHELSTGPKNGFANNLVTSGWGPSFTDFVLVNHRETPLRAFDVGVLRDDSEADELFRLHYVSSTWLGVDPWGTSTAYSLASSQLLRLFEMELSPATYTFTLNNVSGTINWGLSLYAADQAFFSKDDNVEGGISWVAGNGLNEAFTVTVPETGKYSLVAWKSGTLDNGKTGSFEIDISPDLTDVPLSVVSRSRVASIHPSPFNPRTTIAFEVAEPGPVRLDVYSLRGKRVRTLVQENLEAGRHEAIWDGTDDTGSPVATGVYLGRLTAGPVSHSRKMVLLK